MATPTAEEIGYQKRLDANTIKLIKARDALSRAERALLLGRHLHKKLRLINELRANQARLQVDLLSAEECKIQQNFDLLGASSFQWFHAHRAIDQIYATSVRHAYRAADSRERVLRAQFAGGNGSC